MSFNRGNLIAFLIYRRIDLIFLTVLSFQIRADKRNLASYWYDSSKKIQRNSTALLTG